ncbi:MAG: HD domain-containing protein [Desulfobacteraceae bacterium]|nr:HD domain-containing protein [Desulfobacteraceae bacterium]
MSLSHVNQKNMQLQTPLAEPVDGITAHIRRLAQAFFNQARGSHDWEHTLRVHRLCLRIGPIEGADMEVLEAAAYLHDIGRADQDAVNGSLCHAVKGAEKARMILASLPLDKERKQNIIHCVRAHRFRDDHPPTTIEAKVLFDADKLDAIGAVGVARAYLFAGELGACLHNPHVLPEVVQAYSKDDTGHREFVVKLSKIKDRILTAEGRRIAEERHAFMVSFFERFLDEYAGRR